MSQTPFIMREDIDCAGGFTRELMPCPFCGQSKAFTSGSTNDATANIIYKILCLECNVTMHVTHAPGDIDARRYARNAVIERWNTRVSDRSVEPAGVSPRTRNEERGAHSDEQTPKSQQP